MYRNTQSSQFKEENMAQVIRVGQRFYVTQSRADWEEDNAYVARFDMGDVLQKIADVAEEIEVMVLDGAHNQNHPHNENYRFALQYRNLLMNRRQELQQGN